ncbi:MAG: alpha-ketoglutarate-dependent dioxygenase AlkB [Pseudomonadota bacterium]
MMFAANDEKRCELPAGFDYHPALLDARESDALFHTLQLRVNWRRERIRLFGRDVDVPRRVAWCGDDGLMYRYSGQEHRATGWLPALAAVRERAQRLSGTTFNFVLLNYYRDGNDAMAWHSDDEPELGLRPCIAAVSVGATRALRVRPKARPASGRRQSVSVSLASGSLLLMTGASQRDFDHCIPRVSNAGPRISLTFRRLDKASVR